MRSIIPILALLVLNLLSCKWNKTLNPSANSTTDSLIFNCGYSDVNGLKMYYEIYGVGKPLVLIHGGGSTIQSTFGRVIPLLAKHRKLIAVELQAHGRTSDRDNSLSFEQDADDVAILLKNMAISKADFLGFSNGGTTVLQIAIRYPELVHKIVAASALCKRNGVSLQFWDFIQHATFESMPPKLMESYLKVASDSNGLKVMFKKDADRMVHFIDIPDDKIKSIQVPVLIIIGDKEVITTEHAIEMHRLIANSELAILPGGHGEYLGEILTLKPNYKEEDFLAVPLIESFLDK